LSRVYEIFSDTQRILSRITTSLIEALDAGTIPWRKPWTGGFPANFTTDKPYRGINTIMLETVQFSCGYESSQWLTFNQAKKLRAHVKKGEHGAPIIFWKFFEKEKVNEETGETWTDRIPMAKGYTVFNSCQVTGLPEKPANKPVDPIAEAEAIISNYSTMPQLQHGGGSAFYTPEKDAIQMPGQQHFATSEEYYSTLFHECVHSTGHRSRLDRNLSGSHFTSSYANEELIAEMGAAFLMGITGAHLVAKTLDNTAAYINGWRKRISEDHSLIVKAASAAQKAADYITGAVQ